MLAIQILLCLNFAALMAVALVLWPIAKAKARENWRATFREYVIGFGPSVIPAGGTATYEAKLAFDEFNGDRLIVPSILANDFNVCDIIVGESSEGISAHPIPAAAFSEMATGVQLGLKTATKTKPVKLVIRNTTDKQQTFSAAMTGRIPKKLVQYGMRAPLTELDAAAE